MALDRNRIYVAVVVAALAGYWFFSPYVTVYQLQTAAKAGDADAFNRHVDYPQLRDNLKGQLTAMTADPASPAGDILASKLGQLVVDKVTEAFVRPETVMLAMRSGVFKPKQKHAGLPDDSATQQPQWTSSRTGLNTLIVRLAGDDKQLALVLHRQGLLDWKLVNIRLPAEVRQP
jgi:hypothetical protein